MNISQWLRGEGTILLADVQKVFTVASAAVAVAPLPAPIKALAGGMLAGAEAGVSALEGLAGGLSGSLIADGVDDVTTLLMETSQNIGKAKSPADFSAAEMATLHQTWTAMKVQGDTLMAQFIAGIDPVKAAAEAAAAKAEGAAASATPAAGGIQA